MIDPTPDAARLPTMNDVETAHRILDTMLGHLGIAATIETEESADGPCLQVKSADSKFISCRDG